MKKQFKCVILFIAKFFQLDVLVMKFVFLYILIINVIAFLAIAYDKAAARNDEERVRESSLITLAIIGGAFGLYFAMRIFHHKTRKKKFAIGVPVIVLLQVAAAYFLYTKNFFNIF